MLLLVIILCELHGLYGVHEVKFYSGVLCDLEARLGEVCSKSASNFNTLNACVLGCSQDPECVGASVVNKTKCFHHQTCNTVTGCTKQEKKHRYMSKKCAHGGVWNPVTSACTCVNGWVGEHCLDLPSKCDDLIDLGRYSQKGYYPTHFNLLDTRLQIRRPFFAVCHINPNIDYVSVRVFANSVKANFSNRTWHEYRNGFFVNAGNFWIGLDSWHAFSVAGYVYFYVFLNIGIEYRVYHDFYVEDEAREFSFTFRRSLQWTRSGFINIIFPDCFGPLQNSSFSTKDNDRDGVSTENCAQRVGSGWWFSGGSCSSPCNLLGKSPREWALFPTDQWMRLDGTDSALLENYDKSPWFHGYIKIPEV